MIIFGIRLNTSQYLVDKGQPFPISVSKEYGDLNTANDSVLVCGYFTGLRFVHSVYWYSTNNIIGKDSCPIWTNNK
jgi:hypothetical protein